MKNLKIKNVKLLLMKNNPIVDKSFEFAVELVKECYKIQKEKHEYILTRQFIRSAADIDSKINEAIIKGNKYS
jgi:four helix bundle protein